MVSSSGRPSLSSTAVERAGGLDELAPAALLSDRYVVVERVGEGGMGQVWRGFDVKLERAVALKFLHRGSTGAEAKIVREARAMARLSHPNVLPVFDVVTSDGVTFIVMELVTGRTLKDWMTEAHALPEILAVFAAAANGLHAAHVAGFVHRDFKPANVLLGEDGRVRVMDFGLAHESAPPPELPDEVAGVQLSIAGSDAPTMAGVVLGTPAYMAPEQRAGQRVDAASDQYSFCVSLYEAVFGHRPRSIDAPTAYLDAEPGRAPKWLRALLRRGLARAPKDRHPSMADIAARLEARSQPHRGQRIAIAGIVALGLAIAGGGLVRRLETDAARTRCSEQAREIEQAWGPRQRTSVAASLAGSEVPYAAELFDRVAPWLDRYAEEWSSLRTQVCMAATVDGASTVPVELAIDCLDERRVELAALVEQLANADAGVAERAVPSAANLPALSPCVDADTLAERPALPTDPDERTAVLQLRADLARAASLVDAGHHDLAATRVDGLAQQAEALGHAPLVALVHATRGHVAREAGDLDAAKAELSEAFRIARDARADAVAADAAIDLVFVVGRQRSEFAEGLLWAELGTALLERIATQDDPRWAALHTNRGLVLLGQGRSEDALEHMMLAVALTETAVGPLHPWLATPLNNLGLALASAGDQRGAIAQYQRSIAITEANLGPEHPEVAMTLHNIGDVLLDIDETGEGRVYNERALAIWERTVGPDHANVAMALNSIGHAQLNEGDSSGAVATFERAMAIWRETLGEDDPAYAAGLNNLGAVHHTRGELDQAARYYADALALRERILDPMHEDIAATLVNFALLRLGQGRTDEALAMATRALAIVESHRGGDPLQTARAGRVVGQILLARDDARGAAAQLERVRAIETRIDASPSDRGHTDFLLAQALWSGGASLERIVFDPAGRDRALELARGAAELRRSEGERGANAAAKIDAWLRERAGD